MNNNSEDSIFNMSEIIKFIIRYKISLAIICVASLIISAIVCLSITPKFKSTVILFPTSSGSVSQSLITESQQKKDILKFGEEEDVEQLMQLLLSSEIRNRVIAKYDLMNHYKINPESKYSTTSLYNKFDSGLIL